MLGIIFAILPPIALILRFSFALQVIAAFLIFLLGYFALLVSLILCVAIAKGIYEGAQRVRAYAVRPASAESFTSY